MKTMKIIEDQMDMLVGLDAEGLEWYINPVAGTPTGIFGFYESLKEWGCTHIRSIKMDSANITIDKWYFREIIRRSTERMAS